MADTVNNPIPLVPENTIDPAAGLNLALNAIDAMLQVAVLSVGANTPPTSPVDGDRHVVGTSPSGAWAGRANTLARWEQSQWKFYTARYAFNLSNSRMYARNSTGTWGTAAGSDTGWTAGTGTPSKAAFNASTATAAQIAARLLAIEQALTAVGILQP